MKRDTLANSPLDYLKKPIDAAMRKQYQAARLVFCTGQGDGEEEMLGDTTALGRILEAQGIPAWVDIWGQDVTHDWPWWQQQISYFLPRVINIEPR
jgi:esterase/lipase superfamily enzyme